MSKPRSNRTESMTVKISNPDRKRMDRVIDRLKLSSRNEAMNRALVSWLDHVEKGISDEDHAVDDKGSDDKTGTE